jgi:hypothetical protein
MRSLRVLAAFIPLLAGCNPREPESVLVRDSAGVEIVTSEVPSWREGETWVVSESPLLRLGSRGAPPEQQFGRIRGVALLDNGTIVVADGMAQEIRLFDREGAFLRRIGGRGDGPGEFAALMRMFVVNGDSILTWDGHNQRVSIFSPEGVYVRQIQIDPSQTGSVELVGRLPDGSLVLASLSALIGAESPGLHRSPKLFLRYSEEEPPLDTIGILPGFEYAVEISESVVSFEVPFARNAYGAISGKRIFLGSNDRFEIQQLDTAGNLVRLIRYRGAERSITSEEARDLEEKVVAYLDPSPNRLRNIERLFREMPQPPLRPAYSGFLVDEEENIWVADWVSGFAPPQLTPKKWFVFKPQGSLLGSVRMPPGFRPIEIGSDYVLGFSRDELEIEEVDLYHLQK